VFCACFWVRWGLASEFVSGPGAVGGFRVSLGGAGEESTGIRWRGYPGCLVHGFKVLEIILCDLCVPLYAHIMLLSCKL